MNCPHGLGLKTCRICNPDIDLSAQTPFERALDAAVEAISTGKYKEGGVELRALASLWKSAGFSLHGFVNLCKYIERVATQKSGEPVWVQMKLKAALQEGGLSVH